MRRVAWGPKLSTCVWCNRPISVPAPGVCSRACERRVTRHQSHVVAELMEETTSVMNRLSGLQPIDPEDAAARQSLVNDTIAVAAGWTKRADDVYKTKFTPTQWPKASRR